MLESLTQEQRGKVVLYTSVLLIIGLVGVGSLAVRAYQKAHGVETRVRVIDRRVTTIEHDRIPCAAQKTAPKQSSTPATRPTAPHKYPPRATPGRPGRPGHPGAQGAAGQSGTPGLPGPPGTSPPPAVPPPPFVPPIPPAPPPTVPPVDACVSIVCLHTPSVTVPLLS